MKIIQKNEIEKLIDIPSILSCIEEGFALYSRNETTIPPIGALRFADPPGDCHIKYGCVKQGQRYVVKIASSFYNNSSLGLPTGNGITLLFDQETGAPAAVLLDEGLLTDLRTAAAGCLAAKYLAPKKTRGIGIIGTGSQAYFQLKFLEFATSCREATIWGRDKKKVEKFCENIELGSFRLKIAKDLEELTSSCNLIVTTTSSSAPLLFASQIQKGTHVTAVGADEAGKQELDPYLFTKADRIIVDSRSQCAQFGDASYALKQGLIKDDQLVEMGEMILNPLLRRTSDDQLTIADLTGVAIQDLQIAQEIFRLSSYFPAKV